MTDLEPIFRNKYYLDFDYDTVLAWDHYERCANDYCRCTTIQNIRIEQVYISALFDQVLSALSKEYKEISPQHRYVIDRLFAFHRVYDTNLWEIDTCGGYYGEETSDASFANTTSLNYDINTVMDLSTDEAILFALKREYGFILDRLKNKTFTVYSVTIEDIIVPNDTYFFTVDSSASNVSEINGILVLDKDQFILVDGYHRFTNLNKLDPLTQVDYIVAE